MRTRSLLVAAAALLTAGCYRVTVITGAPPAAQAVDLQWQNSFVYGLVPPPVVQTATQCQQGVARVQTERSFLNGLVGGLTWGIYTPIHVTATCASGPVQPQ